MIKLENKIEKILFAFLLINPFLDLIYGLQVYIMNGGMYVLGSYQLVNMPRFSVSLVTRMLLMLVMAVYILIKKNKKAICLGVCIAVSFCLTLFFAYSNGKYSFKDDVVYIARYCFNIISAISYSIAIQSQEDKLLLRQRFNNVIRWTAMVMSLGIVVPYLFNIGFYTYADKDGVRGSRGLFYAGNDVACVLMLLLPFILYQVIFSEKSTKKKDIIGILSIALCADAMLVLSTKTAIAAFVASMIVAVLACVVLSIKDKSIKYIKRLAMVIICIILIIALTSLLYAAFDKMRTWLNSLGLGFSDSDNPHLNPDPGTIGDILGDNQAAHHIQTSRQGILGMLFSGRLDKLEDIMSIYKDGLPVSVFFGISRGCNDHIIEMDLFELIIYYGIVGGLLLAWLYLKNGFIIIKGLFKKFNAEILFASFSIGLCVGYLFLAGHVLFTITAGFYFAITILYTRHFILDDKSDII